MYIIYMCYLYTSESILKQSQEYAAIITLYNGSIYTHITQVYVPYAITITHIYTARAQ